MTHWDNQAKQWALLGSPLKPSPLDIKNSYAWVNKKAQSLNHPLSVLVLGVTPEIVNIPWPVNTNLFAIDCNLSMINSILPTAASTIKPLALLGNWLQLPLLNSSIDIVIGDGCYSSLAANDYALMSKEVNRVLKPTGIFIMRFFSRPEKNESVELIHADTMAGNIASFHAFKLRLAMALHPELKTGVCLKNIWDIWDTRFKQDVQKHMHRLQWHAEVVNSINTYQDSDIIYTFPTMHEIRSMLSHDFIENDIFIPSYYLGLRCPTLKFIPTRSAHE